MNSVKNSKTVFSHRSCSNVNVIRVCVNACTREIRSSRYNPLNAFDLLKYPDSYCFLVEKNHEKTLARVQYANVGENAPVEKSDERRKKAVHNGNSSALNLSKRARNTAMK